MSTEETRLTAPELIEKHLLPGIKRMIDQGFDYLSFPLIAQTIELIGSFFDQNPFDQSGIESQKRIDRFGQGIKQLFKNSAYKNNNSDFYENLRCFFAHQMRPGSGFYLTSLKNGIPKSMHLKRAESDDRFLIIECFYDDLEAAVKSLLIQIAKESGAIDKSKVSDTFLVVKTVPVVSGGFTTQATVSAYQGPQCFTYSPENTIHKWTNDPNR